MSTIKAALEWVNYYRTMELGLLPLDRLPKGVPHKACDCPIAIALRRGIVDEQVICDGTFVYFNPTISDMEDANGLPLPSYVCEFIDDFDSGKFKSLIASRY